MATTVMRNGVPYTRPFQDSKSRIYRYKYAAVVPGTEQRTGWATFRRDFYGQGGKSSRSGNSVNS